MTNREAVARDIAQVVSALDMTRSALEAGADIDSMRRNIQMAVHILTLADRALEKMEVAKREQPKQAAHPLVGTTVNFGESDSTGRSEH